MKTLLKSATLFFALVLTNSLGFAAEKIPEVYVSQSSLTNLTGPQLLNSTWFWIMIAVCLVVGVIALFSAKDQEEASHQPEHAL